MLDTEEVLLVEASGPIDAGLESSSAAGLKVHRALKLLGVRYVTQRLSGASEPHLEVGGEVVRGATRILETLNRKSDRGLVPRCSDQRGEAWLWAELGETSLVQFLEAARWADPDNWRRARPSLWSIINRRRVVAGLTVWREGRQACWMRFQRLLNRLEARTPANGFWLGPDVTVADLAIFAPLRLMQTNATPWQAARLAERSHLAAYLRRVDVATLLGPFAL